MRTGLPKVLVSRYSPFLGMKKKDTNIPNNSLPVDDLIFPDELVEQLSQHLKAISHPIRIKILISLYDKPINFRDFENTVNIGKTALANHLNLLKTRKLVVSNKGTYSITSDGQKMLKTVIQEFYRLKNYEDVLDEEEKKIHLQFLEKHELEAGYLSGKIQFQASWLSFISSFTGVLHYFGLTDLDIVDIGGYSGYIFRTCVAKHSTHASAPFSPAFFDDFISGFEKIAGKKLIIYEDPGFIPPRESLLTEDKNRLKSLWEVTKEQIALENPVIMFGLGEAEFGIVKGYEGNNYVVNTYYTSEGDENNLVPHDKVIALGGLWCCYFDLENNINHELDDMETLEQAIKISSGNISSSDTGWLDRIECW